MSVRLPPHVELMRDETVKTFSSMSKMRSFKAESGGTFKYLFAEAEHVRLDVKVLERPHLSGDADGRAAPRRR